MLSADTYVVHEHPSRPSIRQKRVAWFVLRLAGFRPDFRLAVCLIKGTMHAELTLSNSKWLYFYCKQRL